MAIARVELGEQKMVKSSSNMPVWPDMMQRTPVEMCSVFSCILVFSRQCQIDYVPIPVSLQTDPRLSINIYQLYLHVYHLSFVPILPRYLTNSAFQPVSTCKSTNSSREAKVKVKANQNDPPETWLQEGMFVAWCLFCLQDLCMLDCR